MPIFSANFSTSDGRVGSPPAVGRTGIDDALETWGVVVGCVIIHSFLGGSFLPILPRPTPTTTAVSFRPCRAAAPLGLALHLTLRYKRCSRSVRGGRSLSWPTTP